MYTWLIDVNATGATYVHRTCAVMFRTSKKKLLSKCSTYRLCLSYNEEKSRPEMHHQSLNFPQSSLGEYVRHISLTAALDNSYKQKHRHCLELLHCSLHQGPVVWLLVTHVSEANIASYPKVEKSQVGRVADSSATAVSP